VAPRISSFSEILAAILARRELGSEVMRGLMEEIVSGRWGDAEVAALLTGLRMKGETADEIAAAATVLRQHMVRLDTGRDNVLDTCGTGGDGARTFNISTAAALVAAGAGVPVVKHGNRAVSSHSGSADVLAALGVKIEGDAAWARNCLDVAGLAFCFGPHFHPALRQVGAIRRKLGVRTLFNCLGPLANPAGAPYQLLGVGQPDWLEPLAGALARLQTRRAIVVCGCDGLDEVTLASATKVRLVEGTSVTAWEWTPGDFGLEPANLADLRVDGPEASAARIRAILSGEDGPSARVVLANAAAALMAAHRVATPREGVVLALETIEAGRAREVLERLAATSADWARR
jgi:anthranilate phosphoribosyltransferase